MAAFSAASTAGPAVCEVRLPNGMSGEDLRTLANLEGSLVHLLEQRSHAGLDVIPAPGDDFVDLWHRVSVGTAAVVGTARNGVLRVRTPAAGETLTVRNTGPCTLTRGDLLCAFPGPGARRVPLPSAGRTIALPLTLPKEAADLLLERCISVAVYRFYATRMANPLPDPIPPAVARCRYRGTTLSADEALGEANEAFYARLLARLGFLTNASHEVFTGLLIGPPGQRLRDREASDLVRALITAGGRHVPNPANGAAVVNALQQLPDLLAVARSVAQMTTAAPFGQVVDAPTGRMEILPGEECVLVTVV